MFVFRKLVLKPSKNHSIFGIMQRLRGNPQKEAEIMQNRGVLHKSRGIFQIPGGRICKSPRFFQKSPRFFAFPSFKEIMEPKGVDSRFWLNSPFIVNNPGCFLFTIPFLFDRVFSYDSVTMYFMRKVNLVFPFYMKTCRRRF